MFLFFNKTEVKDDSLKVQAKEYAVKAFNKIMSEGSSLNEKIKPLIEERNSYENRRIELCDYARVCKVLKSVFDEKTFKKVRKIWDEYIEEHKTLTEKQKTVQLEIDRLALERNKLLDKAVEIYNDGRLDELNIKFPWHFN